MMYSTVSSPLFSVLWRVACLVLLASAQGFSAHAQSLGAHAGATDPTAEGWSIAHWIAEDLLVGAHPVSQSSVAPVVNDGGVDAWEILDTSAVNENGGYARFLSEAEEAALATTGFVIEARVKVLENTAPNGARVLVLGTTPSTTDARWVLALGADGDGDPMVSVQGGGTATLEGAGGGYHTYRLELNPASSPLATISIDGQTVLVDQGTVPAEGNKPRFIYFGSWSTAAVGGARYSTVDFSLNVPPTVPSIATPAIPVLVILLAAVAATTALRRPSRAGRRVAG